MSRSNLAERRVERREAIEDQPVSVPERPVLRLVEEAEEAVTEVEEGGVPEAERIASAHKTNVPKSVRERLAALTERVRCSLMLVKEVSQNSEEKEAQDLVEKISALLSLPDTTVFTEE